MDKTPEHCLPSMGTQLLVGGLNFDGLSPCVELDYRGHRLVSRDRVVFTLDLFHSQQLPNGGYFSTALFRLRICDRCRLWQRNSAATPQTTSALRATACPESERSRHSEATAEFRCFLERRVLIAKNSSIPELKKNQQSRAEVLIAAFLHS